MMVLKIGRLYVTVYYKIKSNGKSLKNIGICITVLLRTVTINFKQFFDTISIKSKCTAFYKVLF